MASRIVDVELSARKPSDGTLVGPSPTITVTPDKNLQVRCEGVSADFGSPGQGCAFSSWDYHTSGTTTGTTTEIRALHKVTVRAVAPTSTENPPKSWDLYVSGNGVDGAPVVLTYSIATPASTIVPQDAPMIEKTVNAAAYDTQRDSPYAGAMTITMPTGKAIQIPVQAHVLGDILYLYDQSHFVSPNGVLTLRKYDTWPSPFPGEAYKRWVRLDSSPEYNWEVDIRARLTSFRQQEGNSSGPIEAAGEFALPAVGDTEFLSGETLGDKDLSFSLRLIPKAIPTCSGDKLPPLQKCRADQGCMGGFCSEAYPSGPSDEELGKSPLSEGKPLVRTSSSLDAWIEAGMLAAKSIPPSAIWCAQDENVGFSVSWPSSLFRFPSAMLFDYDLPCVGATASSTRPQITWSGPFPFSHRKVLEQAGTFKEGLTSADLLGRCIRELDRPAPPRGELLSSNFAEFSGILDYKADCVSLGPVAHLLAENRYYLYDYDAYSLRQLYGLISRSGQEWFRLHGFLMHQGVQQRSEEDVLLGQASPTSATTTSGGGTPTLPQLIAIMERGLAFGFGNILNPVLLWPDFAYVPRWNHDYRSSTGMQRCAMGNVAKTGCPSNWRCEELHEARDAAGNRNRMDCDVDVPEGEFCPDDKLWRHCIVDPNALGSSDDVPNSFLPALLDSLTGYLRVVQADLEQTAVARYSELIAGGTSGSEAAALRRYGNAMRLTTFFEAIGARMVATESDCSTGTCRYPRWLDRYGNAARELNLQMEQTAKTAQKLVAGGNPLGVPDDDTPVFFGDVQGTNSRYFASSDYLINTWAGPAVSTARNALSNARDAWIAARNASLTTQQNEAAHQQRLDDIATGAGKSILENCGGLTVRGVALDARSVVESLAARGASEAHSTLDTCFIGGAKECTLSPSVDAIESARASKLTGNVAAARSELCRLDYMRVKAPDAWQKAMGDLEVTANARASRGNLEGFMTNGVLPFCDWCSENSCQSTCIESCHTVCGATPGDAECWKRVEPTCAYRLRDCQYIIDAAAGGAGSHHYYAKTDPDSDYGQIIEYCADEGGPYDDPTDYRAWAQNDCIRQFSTPDEPESRQQLAKSAAKCRKEGVAGETGAPQPRGALSTRWQEANVSGTGRATLVSSIGKKAKESDILPPYVSMEVLGFYDLPLVKLREDPVWNDAVTYCGAQGYGTRLPDWELPKACLRGRLNDRSRSPDSLIRIGPELQYPCV